MANKTDNPTSLKDFMLDAIVNASKFNNYIYQIHVTVTEELGVPESVKKQYANSLMMLSLQSNQKPDPEYNYTKQELSWCTSFNRIPTTVIIPKDNIVAIVDVYGKCVTQFGSTEPIPQVEPTTQNATPEPSTTTEIQDIPEEQPKSKQEPIAMTDAELSPRCVELLAKQPRLRIYRGGKS